MINEFRIMNQVPLFNKVMEELSNVVTMYRWILQEPSTLDMNMFDPHIPSPTDRFSYRYDSRFASLNNMAKLLHFSTLDNFLHTRVVKAHSVLICNLPHFWCHPLPYAYGLQSYWLEDIQQSREDFFEDRHRCPTVLRQPLCHLAYDKVLWLLDILRPHGKRGVLIGGRGYGKRCCAGRFRYDVTSMDRENLRRGVIL
jgi:hypothetical protein